MAIKVQGTTVIDDSRNIENIGSANLTSLSIGGTAVTATATELNYVDGVTSPLQTQLDDTLKYAWSIITTTHTAAAGSRILADTSGGAFTITLPATPTNGDEVWFADPGANWATNNLTISGNGNNVDGAATFIADVDEGHFIATYNGTAWVVRFAKTSGGDLTTASTSGASQTINFDTTDIHVSTVDEVIVTYTFSGASVVDALRLVVDIQVSDGYNIDTASYDSVSFSVNAQDANPSGIAFNNDGTKMYIVGRGSGDSVHQYTTGESATLVFPSEVESPAIPIVFNKKTALEIITTDGGTTYQVTNVQGDIA